MFQRTNVCRLINVILSILIVCCYIGCSGDGSKQSRFASKQEFESAITVSFHTYAIIGAQIPDDSNLMLMYAKGDFLKIYDQNEEELKQLFRDWLNHLYEFKGKKEAVGILVRQGLKDVFHASRDRKGNVFFRPM